MIWIIYSTTIVRITIRSREHCSNVVADLVAVRVDVNHGTAVNDIIVEEILEIIKRIGIPHLKNIVKDFVH